MNPTLIRGNMRYWLLEPDPRLRSRVLCYFLALPPADEPFRAPPPAACEEELLIPDGHAEIVFNVDGAYERWVLGQPDRRCVMRHSYVIGGRSHSVLTRDLSAVTVAGVKLDPRALRWLIGASLFDFRDSTLPLSELDAPGLMDLEDAVANASSAGQVASVLDLFLLRALRDMPAADRVVDALLRDIRLERGALSILDWARERAIDARHLERRFCAAIGMMPKRYARVIRFKHSYHALLAGRTKPERLHLDGFYDQSHFNKEFRTFIGAAPTVRLNATLRQGTSISDHLLAGELAKPPSMRAEG